MSRAPRDPWVMLEKRTPARIALGRTGASLPTREVLGFSMAHARARDAVHAELDATALIEKLQLLSLETIEVRSRASDRASYLRRPDLGRTLDSDSHRLLARARRRDCVDVALVVADGLSAVAAVRHAPAVIEALFPHLSRLSLSVGPVVVAREARVALGDEIGAGLDARLVVVLIGERPGLSAPDSLSAYLTFAPRPGRMDAERNCLSNIRPDGLAPSAAAANLAWLIDAAFKLGMTGVGLKDQSGTLPGPVETIAALPRDRA